MGEVSAGVARWAWEEPFSSSTVEPFCGTEGISDSKWFGCLALQGHAWYVHGVPGSIPAGYAELSHTTHGSLNGTS